MGRISERFQQLRAEKRSAFIPYIAAGDPDLQATASFVKTLAAQGADIIELGVPFSDPIADGPTNQLAAERALASGTTLTRILELVTQLRQEGFNTPLLLFSYLNPLLARGWENFCQEAATAGIDGVLLVDLPPEEAQAYLPALQANHLETVFLASPTSPVERLKRTAELSSGFIYYVSRTGVTGVQQQLSSSLASELTRLRQLTDRPIAVGFGIATPEQAAQVAQLADGVIVGSALVKLIETHADPAAANQALASLSHNLVQAIQET